VNSLVPSRGGVVVGEIGKVEHRFGPVQHAGLGVQGLTARDSLAA
jgi:hypothetical protein